MAPIKKKRTDNPLQTARTFYIAILVYEIHLAAIIYATKDRKRIWIFFCMMPDFTSVLVLSIYGDSMWKRSEP